MPSSGARLGGVTELHVVCALGRAKRGALAEVVSRESSFNLEAVNQRDEVQEAGLQNAPLVAWATAHPGPGPNLRCVVAGTVRGRAPRPERLTCGHHAA